MSKRFGRNQRRKLLAQNAEMAKQLEHMIPRILQAEVRIHELRQSLKDTREVFVKIGWAQDCDAIRKIDYDLQHFDGRRHHQHTHAEHKPA